MVSTTETPRAVEKSMMFMQDDTLQLDNSIEQNNNTHGTAQSDEGGGIHGLLSNVNVNHY